MLVVTTPADDKKLLSMEEMRDAAGVVENTYDNALMTLNEAVSAMIAKACHVIPGSGADVPTLRSEVLTETFNMDCPQDYLRLSRRPVTAIGSVALDGVALTLTTDYLFGRHFPGAISHMSGTRSIGWAYGGVAVVVYTAGWITVPPDLKMAAQRLVQFMWSQQQRDPLMRSESMPGLGTYNYWVGQLGPMPNGVPQEVHSMLQGGGYINTWLA